MFGAARVDINLQMMVFLEKGARGAGVVEMNVGKENGLKIMDGTMLNGELLVKIPQGRSGTGVDQRAKISGQQQSRGDGTRSALPMQIQRDDGIHKTENSVTQRNPRMQKMALRQRGRGVWGSSRKHLQNDELVEYALGTAAGVHQYLAARERFSRKTAH
jgi:hypothetical protein